MKKIIILLFLSFCLYSFGASPKLLYAQYCICGDGTCSLLCGETTVTCPADCGPGTFTVNGNVYVDTNSNGSKDGGESNYSGATVALTGNGTRVTNGSGNYTFNNVTSGNKTVTLTVPSGYSATTTNPRSISLGPDTTVNFGIILIPPPSCVGGMSVTPVSPVNPGGSTTLSVTTCTNVEDPDDGVPPSPFNWNPDTGGNNPPPTISGQTDTSTSSTTTWTAPACPAVQTVYSPRVTVAGTGGTINYNTSITVPATYTMNVLVREVSSLGACAAGSGNPYSGSSVNINVTGGSLPVGGTTQSTSTGSTSFVCLPNANYQTTLALPSGYDIIGTSGGTSSSGNTINSTPLSSNSTLVYCIAPLNPWFQTSSGDVRFLNLSNPVPTGLYASTDVNYPGIFYSSDSTADLGNGSASIKNWVIDNEYSYNADTENRNGGMSYDFYKSKTKQDGVTVTPISSGTFDQTQITASGVYESPADLTINLYSHVNGRRVVILVNGNVTINASTISIAQNQGIFIVAAKGNITIAKTIGTSTLSSSTSSIDGYYTAQGSIILDGDTCPDTVTPDLRLNVGGALIANSLKPYATSGTGTVQNRRSLCVNNLLYPSLYIGSRPDFITQLTDFYKTSYTKWQEVSP